MDQLEQLIKMSNALQDMSKFMAQSNDIANKTARKDSLCEAGQFISTADLKGCKWLLIELADRVATLTGCCDHIEDAICDLDIMIKSEEV